MIQGIAGAAFDKKSATKLSYLLNSHSADT
jgi:hypothetical protein